MPAIPVCLNHCASYETKLLRTSLQEQLDLLEVPSDLSFKRVLFKPNLLSGRAPALACSSPLFTVAVADCFLSRGATVLLGDSPAFGSAAQVLKQQGFVPHFSGRDITPVSFQTRVVKKLACGISVGVAAEALDCDYFVNLPRIKAHGQMGVTMAVKNVFGIVLGARKAWLHMRHGGSCETFARMILDLQELLPPAFVLADGIEVMSDKGPMHGNSLMLGCLAASRSSVALDRAMIEVLEVDRDEVPLVRAAQEKKIQGSRLRDIVFPQYSPSTFAGSGFSLPAIRIPIRFGSFRYLKSSLKRMVSR